MSILFSSRYSNSCEENDENEDKKEHGQSFEEKGFDKINPSQSSIIRSASSSLNIKQKNKAVVKEKTQSPLEFFIAHIPSWGAKAIRKSQCKPEKITNTCTIDYGLLFLWFSAHKTKLIRECIKNSDGILKRSLLSIIDLINEKKWDEAKSVWVFDVLKLNKNVEGNYSTWGSEYDNFVKYVICLQEHTLKFSCCCTKISNKCDTFSFIKTGRYQKLNFEKNVCGKCFPKIEV